ncbi:hypothetical protein [Hymenobacter nivis]|uniref:Uncharacterized protein n=1 Tax=Hymenobacter nivis TaxID=1850093 RepID=A0A2Z3GVA3_9BACT|nr:hypothetical protein [Hymenobacter nivis]AWM34935.1 hypothetical protein DDQ68_20435 [Hymenobacter nivis]
MELDDLRASWKQPVPVEESATLNEAALMRLLARGSGSPVAKMRRNAWLEIGFVLVCLAVCLGVAISTQDSYYLTSAAWLGLICLLSGLYYRRKLAVLRSLGEVAGRAVREHIGQQLQSLRSLVELYYRATIWSVPASLTVSLLFVGGRMVQRFAEPRLATGLGLLGMAYGVMGVLLYVLMRRATNWYLHRLYGQHLDRLEANLRELDELGGPGA